jgi:epoxyqueuosine reductase
MEFREPMGMYVYGCDQCQNVCPRNNPWLAQELPLNKKVVAKAPDFELTKLLHMDSSYYETKIWPHMFYITHENIWKWKMNVARVMGNSLDPLYVPELIRAIRENDDERVKRMCTWALGRIGGDEACSALREFHKESSGSVRGEIELALD